MRDDRGRLQDILDAIKRIERYAKRGRRVFEEDELVHTWMIHHNELRDDWTLAEQRAPLKKIKPLE